MAYWRELPQVSFLSRQSFVATKPMFVFVATKHVFCRDKTFVATKMILVAALANDTIECNVKYLYPEVTQEELTTKRNMLNTSDQKKW